MAVWKGKLCGKVEVPVGLVTVKVSLEFPQKTMNGYTI